MRVLVAIDDTAASHRAFEFMLNIIKPQDEIILLAVYEGISTYVPGPFDPVKVEAMNLLDSHLREQVKKVLKAHGRKIVEKGYEHSCFLIHGPANETICKEAKYHKVDLIIMGRRETSGIRRVLRDSHSAYVLHNAHCDVLVIKEECDEVPSAKQAEHVHLE